MKFICYIRANLSLSFWVLFVTSGISPLRGFCFMHFAVTLAGLKGNENIVCYIAETYQKGVCYTEVLL